MALFQELQPGTPVERLEMDRVQRGMALPKTNSSPREIIAKLHYYHTKKQLLAAVRGKDALTFQGHAYQIFADPFPLTVR